MSTGIVNADLIAQQATRAIKAEAECYHLRAAIAGTDEAWKAALARAGMLETDLAEARARVAQLEAQQACRGDTDQCVMDEGPEIPCDERNCRYMAIVARAEGAEAELAEAQEVLEHIASMRIEDLYHGDINGNATHAAAVAARAFLERTATPQPAPPGSE